jgi:hypothetical protein
MDTLTNSGTETLEITSIAASGNFAETNDCAESLEAGASCTIDVTFVPLAVTSAAASGGTVTITDNASTSPQSLTLTGPVVTGATGALSPKSLTFGSQVVGTTSSVQTVTLADVINGTATVALGIYSIEASGDFAIVQNACGNSVVAGGSCTISIDFSPTASGVRTGLLTVVDNAPIGLVIIPLSGTGE